VADQWWVGDYGHLLRLLGMSLLHQKRMWRWETCLVFAASWLVAVISCTGGQVTASDAVVGVAAGPNYNDQFAAVDYPLLPSAADDVVVVAAVAVVVVVVEFAAGVVVVVEVVTT